MKIRSLLVIAVLATAILCSAGAVNAQTPTVQGLMNQIAQLQAQLSSQPAGSVGNLMLQIQILQLQLQLLQLQSATPTRPSISIVSPVANAQLMQGQTYNISWTSSGINTMSINILNQGTAGNWASIVENIPASSGSYSWTVPSAMTPGNYAIYFSDNDSGYTNIPNTIAGYTNLSFNNGSISVIAATPNQPSITVTSPASGVQWAQGSTQNIAWTSTGASASDTIYIKLINDAGNSQNGNNVYSITPAGTTISPSLGSYNWTIPSSLALGSQYYIAIYDSNPSVASRSSNHFSIVAATPQHLITVSAVNPTYLVSIPIPATWQMNYSSSSMFVSLYDSVANTNMFVSRPLAGAVGSNSYTIQLASNAAPGQYMLYVCDGAPASNGSGSNASSANPTLCGSTGPIAITSVAPVPPVAYYPFEGNANDASGNGNNGTATGAVLTPGETGQAYIFNGKNNYIDVPSASSLEPSSGVSVSAWIKTSGTNAYSGIVEKMRLTGGSQTAGYLLSISNKNTAAFYIGNGKGYSQATGKTNLAQNKWMFVTGTWDASTKKISIYVNGVLDGTGSYSSISYNAGDMTIGWDKYAANRHFNGSIDEVKVWSRVLSPSDVLNEYNSSGPTGLNTLQNNLASITDALNAIEQEIQSLMNR